MKRKIELSAPAALSGLLLIFSFPTFDLYPLAWIALVPLLVSLWNKKPFEAFACGVVTGIISFFGTLYWIYHSITYYGSVPLPASLSIVFLLSLYLSLYPGLFALLFSVKVRSTKLPALVLAPVFWVCLEFIRSYAFTGFPWSSIGYSQYTFLYGIQFADITGIYGVSFLVVAVNGAIADIFLSRKRMQEMPLFPARQALVSSVIIFVVILSVFSYGSWRMHEHHPGSLIRVGIVQGNIDQSMKWDPAYQNEVIDIYKKLSREAAASSPSLLIWPETALPFFFGEEPRSHDLVVFQRQLDTYLLFGSVMVKAPPSEKGPPLLTNSAILLDKNGTVSYIYDKIHLVPFGEYVPLRGVLFFLNKLVAGIGDYVPGDSLIKAHTVFGSFGTFICYEIIFPGLIRKFYARSGDFIVTITNDAWFGRTAGPYQHFSMAVFRAIENRKPVVRAANTGVSGFIDSKGRILKTSAVFTRQIETMDIRTDGTRSFYSRYGDIFSYLCIVSALIFLILL
ncbi:MAG TPA: apolipoprotein N-acyltransferase [Thermodesulfovibrionales bacterium]|nr:apolipoprotein N-acyltransferase [Thermodesulfovibrionales bacterium]